MMPTMLSKIPKPIRIWWLNFRKRPHYDGIPLYVSKNIVR